MAYGRGYYAEDANELQPEHFSTERKKIDNDEEDFEDEEQNDEFGDGFPNDDEGEDEEFDEDEGLFSPSLLSRFQVNAPKFLIPLLKNPATWYVAGVIDTILVATFFLHWIKS